MIEFEGWPKTPRLFRDITITEKIDGTNAAVLIEYVPDGPSPEDAWDDATMTAFVSAQPPGWEHPGDFIVAAQSRKRMIVPGNDNYGFAAWVRDNAQPLAMILGEGRHFGEWWGSGIQRGYGLPKGERRFSLFNVHRYAPMIEAWTGLLPELDVVPTLYRGGFGMTGINYAIDGLVFNGSYASPGFDRPEGIVVHHSASRQVYKVLLENDDLPKGLVA